MPVMVVLFFIFFVPSIIHLSDSAILFCLMKKKSYTRDQKASRMVQRGPSAAQASRAQEISIGQKMATLQKNCPREWQGYSLLIVLVILLLTLD